MSLGRFLKTPTEVKRYVVDYSSWLDTTEKLDSASFVIDPVDAVDGLTVLAHLIDTSGKLLSYYVSGGNDTETYNLIITVTTQSSQVKQDLVVYIVRDIQIGTG